MITDDPCDRPSTTWGRLRFVVLFHSGVASPHFDIMFESNDVDGLITFRSPVWPIESETTWQQIGLHRQEYLEFEGRLSGDRGEVRRVAAGTYWIAPAGGLQSGGGALELANSGENFAIVRLGDNSWQIRKCGRGPA